MGSYQHLYSAKPPPHKVEGIQLLNEIFKKLSDDNIKIRRKDTDAVA